MGGMKSGTGDVWGDDDEDDEAESVEADDELASVDGDDESGRVEESESGVERERDDDTAGAGGASRREAGERAGSAGDATAGADDRNDIADNAISRERESAETGPGDGRGGGEQPYVVRRMLKDKSVQFERDERLTLFVHDDVKAGEQELEAEAQELFGRDIPVFDIREAVYRAALRNREDVVDELEEMGYSRE